MSEKIVHFHIFKPHNSIFKRGQKEKASCYHITCNNYNNCDLYKRGECAYLRPLETVRCPYGNYHAETGFTKKARKYDDWIREREKRFEGCNSLKMYSDRIAFIGDYVFLPYSHMYMYKDGDFKIAKLLPKEQFTIDLIVQLIKFVPKAFFFNEPIKNYQNKIVPRFLIHLKEDLPDTYKKVCEAYPQASEYNLSSVGRKAFANTLKNGTTIDDKWKFEDGYFISTTATVLSAPFRGGEIEKQIKIKADDKATIEIKSDDWVCDETKFEE